LHCADINYATAGGLIAVEEGAMAVMESLGETGNLALGEI